LYVPHNLVAVRLVAGDAVTPVGDQFLDQLGARSLVLDQHLGRLEQASGRLRKRIEEVFGWAKAAASFRAQAGGGDGIAMPGVCPVTAKTCKIIAIDSFTSRFRQL
jgi:hypothetical protein